MSTNLRMRAMIAMSALGLGACGSTGEEGQLGIDAEQIIGGTTVATDLIGTARVTTPTGGTCSGTILHSAWLLTAGHCVTTNGAIGGPIGTPSSVSARLLNGSNTPTGVAIFRHPTFDVALVRLNAAPLNAAGQKASNRLYLGDLAALQNQSIFTQGWGNNAITDCTPLFQGTGAGTLRSATVQISNVSGGFYTTIPTGGQIEWTGDSGSSLYKTVNGIARPIGVESTGQCTDSPLAVTSIGHVRGDFFRDWAQGIIGTAPAAGTPAAYERADGISAVVYPNFQTNRVRELALTSTGWTLNDLNTAANSSILASSEVSAYVRGDSASSVVFRGSDGHVRELALNSSGWHATDLSGAGVSLVSGGRPAAYVRSDHVNVVVYRGTDNHVHELSQGSNGTWSNSDLSTISGAPAAAGDPIGYVRADAVNAVTYKTSGGHVIEIALSGGQWGSSDLSNIVGATDAGRLVSFGPRPYTRPDGVTAIIYVDASKRIQEVSLSNGSFWGINSFSAFTGTSTNVAVPFVRADGVAAVVYINTDSHVREAALQPTGWVVTDLSAATGSPAPLNPTNGVGSIVSGYVRGDRVTSVVYQASDHHVIELARATSSWSFADLTNAVGGL